MSAGGMPRTHLFLVSGSPFLRMSNTSGVISCGSPAVRCPQGNDLQVPGRNAACRKEPCPCSNPCLKIMEEGYITRTTTLGRMLYCIQWSMQPTLSLHAHACLATDVSASCGLPLTSSFQKVGSNWSLDGLHLHTMKRKFSLAAEACSTPCQAETTELPHHAYQVKGPHHSCHGKQPVTLPLRHRKQTPTVTLRCLHVLVKDPCALPAGRGHIQQKA